MINDENRQKVYIAAALIFILLLSGFVWFFCAGRSDVSDIRRGADTVRNELESAREEQREQREAIDKAGNAANRSAESIKDSQRTATEIKRLERSDAEIIRESQSILDRVRERGGAENQS